MVSSSSSTNKNKNISNGGSGSGGRQSSPSSLPSSPSSSSKYERVQVDVDSSDEHLNDGNNHIRSNSNTTTPQKSPRRKKRNEDEEEEHMEFLRGDNTDDDHDDDDDERGSESMVDRLKLMLSGSRDEGDDEYDEEELNHPLYDDGNGGSNTPKRGGGVGGSSSFEDQREGRVAATSTPPPPPGRMALDDDDDLSQMSDTEMFARFSTPTPLVPDGGHGGGGGIVGSLRGMMTPPVTNNTNNGTAGGGRSGRFLDGGLGGGDIPNNGNNHQTPQQQHYNRGEQPSTSLQFFSSVVSCVTSGDFRSIPLLYQSMRMESRFKRVERALAMDNEVRSSPGDDYGSEYGGSRLSQTMLCLGSWCELSEMKGILVLVGFVIVFVGVYKLLEDTGNDTLRNVLLICGILGVLGRVLWYPVYWYIWGRRVNRRRQRTMELYDGLNGEAAAGCTLTGGDANSPSDDMWEYEDDIDEAERRNLGLEICSETGQAGIVV